MSAYKSYIASIEMANTARKIVEATDFRAQVDNFSAEACARCDAASVADLAAKATELRNRIVSDTRLLGRPLRHTTITNVRNTAMHLLGQVSAYAFLTSDDDTINDAYALRGDVLNARDAALGTFRTKKSR